MAQGEPDKFRMYVDETGNSDLGSSDDQNHRYLGLTGVVLNLKYVADVLQPELEALKRRFFTSHPDDPVVLHRSEIINARPPFEALRDDHLRNQFDRELLQLLSEWQYVVITVCIDKRDHRDMYESWRYDPYHYCLAVLLERFIFFLRRSGLKGDVMAESRGGREDRRLKDSYERLWENGTEYVVSSEFRDALTSKQLKVKPKINNIAGLQLADLLANPSRNEILSDHGLLPRELALLIKRS